MLRRIMREKQLKKNEVREIANLGEERKHILSDQSDFFQREAYKTLRTNVTFSLAGEPKHRIVLVTSSLKGEGKSITSLNLAISYTQIGCRVLLIDCDMRRPKLARLVRRSAKAGLSNVLLDPDLEEQAIIKDYVKNLDLLLAGDVPPNPSELLGSAQMSGLLEGLREKYDYILLDTPPVDMVTDAVVLATKCSGVLLVVRMGETERGAVAHAIEQLEYANVKLLGFILNGVDMKQNSYGRYKRYGYGYGYGYTQSAEQSRQSSEGGAK